MRNINRRKFYYFSLKNLITLFLIFSIIISSIIFYIQKNYFINIFNQTIIKFSKNYGYNLINIDINGTKKIEKESIEKILNQYLYSSIFLLPLDEISNKIKNNNWVNSVKVKTNYKDTIYVDIIEYKILGLYKFNNKLFLFDSNGKIIDQVVNQADIKKKFILFKGQSSNLNAKNIINILENLNFQKKFNISYIEFIKNRRWDVILNENIKLMLSEDDPKKSLKNFLKIVKSLSEIEINNIKYIDLRIMDKAIITYKND